MTTPANKLYIKFAKEGVIDPSSLNIESREKAALYCCSNFKGNGRRGEEIDRPKSKVL